MKKRSDFADIEWRMANTEPEQRTFEALNAQLNDALSLTKSAQSEYDLGDRGAAERSQADAEKSFLAAVNCLPHVEGLTNERREELECKVAQLRDAISRLGQANSHSG